MIIGKYKWITDNKQASNDMVEDLLEDRGIITAEDKKMFLSPDFEKMHDPMLLTDMKKAVKRIEKAQKSHEKITIYGDYDVDGITSTSILYLFLRENGCDVDYYIPNRVSEGYGFNNEALDKIHETGSSLIISVDTGISANDEVDFAKTLGMDIIITDHHECMEVLPDAHAIINPKRFDCKYPFKELAGVGVAFKLIHALAISWNKVETIWPYIDIVAIGTVADIVPLVDENRIIVKNAFDTISSTWNVGLEALLEVSGSAGKKISAGTIGFQIGPRLNVAGRLGDAKKGVELFTTEDREKAKQIALELDGENKERQKIEQEIFDLAVKKIEEDPEIHKKNIIVVSGEGWHNGVVGIVASRITELYYKPSIVISIEDGKGTGSARSIKGFNLFDALCHSEDYLTQFGGHDMAAGLSLDAERISGFRNHINAYGQEIIDEEMLQRKLKIDYTLTKEHITVAMAEDLERLEPYGVGNPKPVFAYPAKVYSVKGIGAGGSHLKMQLYTPDRLIDSIGFNMGEQRHVIATDEDIIIAGNLQTNEWLGKVTLQLVIRDIQSPEAERLESEFYLSLYKMHPEPTAEDLKAFTNSMDICYISSYDDKEFLQHIVPTRDDAIAIYRYMKEISAAKTNQCAMHALKREVKKENMTEYKVLQILDVFTELGLVNYQYNDNHGLIAFTIIEGVKTDLSKSKRYKHLCRLNEDILI